jgi:LysR family glycine cleavage system transcriptional activator
VALPDIESLRCFVVAARTLNFRQASQEVGLTPAALGQRIKQLEDQVGVSLFARTTRKVELTEAGLSMLPRAQATLEQAESCVMAARGELGPAPMDITIGTRHELGLSWIQPMLPDLGERFAHINFHLFFGSGEDLNRRVLARELDCGISSRRAIEPNLDFIQLHQENYVFVGERAVLDQQPAPDESSLKAHRLIDVGPELHLLHYLRQTEASIDPQAFGGFRWMGTISAIRSAVLAGEGLAVLPLYLVQDDLDTGRLAQVWPERTLVHDWFRLLFRADDPRVSLFRALGQAMRGHSLK